MLIKRSSINGSFRIDVVLKLDKNRSNVEFAILSKRNLRRRDTRQDTCYNSRISEVARGYIFKQLGGQER